VKLPEVPENFNEPGHALSSGNLGVDGTDGARDELAAGFMRW